MGVVLCKRPHRACLFSRFLTIVPLPGLFGLMSLLLNICGFFFPFVLVIKRDFSQLLSICLLLLAYPGSPGGSEKRDRGICVPAGWKAH